MEYLMFDMNDSKLDELTDGQISAAIRYLDAGLSSDNPENSTVYFWTGISLLILVVGCIAFLCLYERLL